MNWLFRVWRRPSERALGTPNHESGHDDVEEVDGQSEIEATSAYLGLALTEHLAMRSEMNDVVRHNFNLVLAALGIAAGTAALAAADTFDWREDQRGFVLLVAAGFGFIVLLASIGIFNSYKILEWYVERTSADIAAIGRELRPDARLTGFQPAIRQFVIVNPRHIKRTLALIVSYGMIALVGVVVVILLAAMAWAGFSIGSSASPGGLRDWILFVFVGDLVLGALAIGAFWLTFHIQNDWGRILDPSGANDKLPITPAGYGD